MKCTRVTVGWVAAMAIRLSAVHGAEEAWPKPVIQLAAPFRDNAILQREMSVPIWGWSQPGAAVTVEFAGQKKIATAGKDGGWIVRLDPLKASAEAAEMTISGSEGKKVALKNILVGEVWHASGQSNMEWPLIRTTNAAAFIAKDLPAMKWATVSPKYEYGFTCWKMFQETLKKLKPGVSFPAESWAPAGTTDFRSHINTVMDANPDGLYSTEWAGELITFLKQAKQAGLFDKIKHIMLPVGAAMDVLEGMGQEMPDNLWISGRYFFLYPNNKNNTEWVARFRKRWNHFPAYVSEGGYSAIYALKAAVEKSGSKETKALIQALEGMELETPAGNRVFRKEDHQALYDVPWGKTKADPKYPFKVMGEMKVIPAKQYFSRPPFEGPGADPPFSS